MLTMHQVHFYFCWFPFRAFSFHIRRKIFDDLFFFCVSIFFHFMLSLFSSSCIILFVQRCKQQQYVCSVRIVVDGNGHAVWKCNFVLPFFVTFMPFSTIQFQCTYYFDSFSRFQQHNSLLLVSSLIVTFEYSN